MYNIYTRKPGEDWKWHSEARVEHESEVNISILADQLSPDMEVKAVHCDCDYCQCYGSCIDIPDDFDMSNI